MTKLKPTRVFHAQFSGGTGPNQDNESFLLSYFGVAGEYIAAGDHHWPTPLR